MLVNDQELLKQHIFLEQLMGLECKQQIQQ